MSISVHCQWCGAANNTAGRCTDMMCRGGDARPAVVEVGIDLRDAEIARLRKQVEDLIVAAGGRWRRMATSTTCGETWEQYALERDAEIAALRARVAELEADAKIGRVVREFDAEARDILGRPCFTCGRIAEVLRRMGRTIPPKAEDEQAEVLRWMLGLYAEHGAQWREKGDEELRAALAALEVPRG